MNRAALYSRRNVMLARTCELDATDSPKRDMTAMSNVNWLKSAYTSRTPPLLALHLVLSMPCAADTIARAYVLTCTADCSAARFAACAREHFSAPRFSLLHCFTNE
jgi:hypothetical protein